MRRLGLQTWLMLEPCAFVRLTNMEHDARKTWPDPRVSRWKKAPQRPTGEPDFSFRQTCDQRWDQIPSLSLSHFLHIPEPLLLSSSDAAESVKKKKNHFSGATHQPATIIPWSVCVVCGPGIRQKEDDQALLGSGAFFFFFWFCFFFCSCGAEAQRLWSVPAPAAPPGRAHVYNWTKAETHTVL